jgi:hypothetical protein
VHQDDRGLCGPACGLGCGLSQGGLGEQRGRDRNASEEFAHLLFSITARAARDGDDASRRRGATIQLKAWPCSTKVVDDRAPG